MEHCVEIALTGFKYAASYQGQQIGVWRVPECDAARWLLANGKAAADDTLVSTRNGAPALHGSVGWFAARTVEENEKVSPRWTKWRPFSIKPKDAAATVCGGVQEARL